jgi:DNA-binding CsgD family transcriptional regulator
LTHDEERMPRIFISYAPEDTDFVVWLSESLRSLGHHSWINRTGILGGLQTLEAIHQALDDSDIMLLIITPNALRSRLVNSEWTYFFCECGKKLIPLLIEPLEPPNKINFMLASLQYVDFYRDDRESALISLHQTLRGAYAEREDADQERSTDPIPRTYGPPDHLGMKDELSADKAGVVHVHLDFPIYAHRAWLREACLSIKVLNTWTSIFAKHDNLLLDAINRGVSVQTLLLDPSSPVAKQRSFDLHLGEKDKPVDEDEVPKNIRTSIRQFANLYPSLEGLKGELELRLYHVLPSFSVHVVDNQALVGFFPHAARSTGFPLFEIKMESPFGMYVAGEFERIWNSSTVVDLSPQLPMYSTEANRTLAEPLSHRELEIMRLISAGLSNQEIASKLVVTVATVKKHINNLYSKLGVTSRTRALLRAHELGLI